jgi:hypothetical protein
MKLQKCFDHFTSNCTILDVLFVNETSYSEASKWTDRIMNVSHTSMWRIFQILGHENMNTNRTSGVGPWKCMENTGNPMWVDVTSTRLHELFVTENLHPKSRDPQHCTFKGGILNVGLSRDCKRLFSWPQCQKGYLGGLLEVAIQDFQSRMKMYSRNSC